MRAAKIVLNQSEIELYVRPQTSQLQRQAVLEHWYRQQLSELVALLRANWHSTIGIEITSWSVEKTKAYWGLCDAETWRIWPNVELAQKPSPRLEYVIVHELVHLREQHNQFRFLSLMAQHLPQWRLRPTELLRVSFPGACSATD